MPPKKRVKKVCLDESDSENAEIVVSKSTNRSKRTVLMKPKSKEPIDNFELDSGDTENDENDFQSATTATDATVLSKQTRASKRTISVRKSLELESKANLNQDNNTSKKLISNILTSSSIVNQPLSSSSSKLLESSQKSNTNAGSKLKKVALKALSNKNSKSTLQLSSRLKNKNDEELMDQSDDTFVESSQQSESNESSEATKIKKYTSSSISESNIEDYCQQSSQVSTSSSSSRRDEEEEYKFGDPMDIIEAPREINEFTTSYKKIDCIHPLVIDEQNSKKAQKDWQVFFIGEYNLKFKSKKVISAENSQVFLYREQKWANRIILDNNIYVYYLYIVNNMTLEYELVNILESDIMQKHVVELLAEKSIKIGVKSINKNSEIYEIKCNVFLTNKLNNETISEFPSDFFKNMTTQAINNVMNNLYFSKKNKNGLKLVSDKFGCDLDEFIEREPDNTEYKTAQETLFELVHNLNHKYNAANQKEIEVIQENSGLKPKLRRYQINAIKWLLHKENFDFETIGMDCTLKDDSQLEKDENDPQLHPLYVKIVNKDGKIIYFHKYLGVFSNIKPHKQKTLAGGILADEMGLGKTLEILAAININRRTGQLKSLNSVIEEQEKNENKIKTTATKKEAFSCVCGNKPEAFKTNFEKETSRHDVDQDDEDDHDDEREYGKRSKSKKPKRNPIRREPTVAVNNQTQQLDVYQCALCKLWMHAKCVNYNGTRETFICLPCHEKIPPIPSACTLIVTPSIISQQWADEIQKHLNKKLKVLFYKGFSKSYRPHPHQSRYEYEYNSTTDFVQPRDLANLDICITTYDVLAEELAHVFAIENSKVLRHPKRFMTLPSPLLYVEFWRICLDEAQMVHSTNTRCADMANRLNAINRWCITGTPIGRSLSDLNGLFKFIRQDPFCEKRWFDEVLFHPFNSGDKMPMAIETSKVLWRTTKNLVENQVNLPPLIEKVYRLNFSPFELHLYERVQEDFRKNNKQLLENTANSNTQQNDQAQTFYSNKTKLTKQKNVNDYNPYLRLDELDRQIIDQILAPILDLRVTCDHPQLILRKAHFIYQSKEKKEKLLTMEKSLELLMKKTKSESEKIHRSIISTSIDLASIKFQQEKYEEAIDLYQNFLDSEKELEVHDIKSNNLQLIHTYHNYIQAIEKLNEKNAIDLNNNLTGLMIESSKINTLKIKLKESEQSYMLKFDEEKQDNEQGLKKSLEKNNFFTQSKNYAKECAKELGDLFDGIKLNKKLSEFWKRITDRFGYNKVNDYMNEYVVENVVFGKLVTDIDQIKLIITNELERLLIKRENTINMIMSLFDKKTSKQIKNNQRSWCIGITQELVTKAAQCHLRRDTTTKTREKCQLCEVNDALSMYTGLFDPRYTSIEPNKDIIAGKHRIESHSTTDLEDIIKIASDVFQGESKKDFKKFYLSLKTEQIEMSTFFDSVFNQIKAYDEIEIAKMKKDIRAPVQYINNYNYYIQKNNASNFKNELDSAYTHHQIEKSKKEQEFRKKLNQIIYLKNLAKTYNMADGEENKEECPICGEVLGFEWYILSCGHLFCRECNFGLLKSSGRENYLTCAICRESCCHTDSYLVSTVINKAKDDNTDESMLEEDNELKNVKIEGAYNSAKIEGVVKCLVKIMCNFNRPKCIVFSEHLIVLELIKKLLDQNEIKSVCIKNISTFDKSIAEFKNENKVNVLLMPYSYGANGLNLIEATHVLLVEPTLNKSQEAQAIGRIHRIGQTRSTYVHRFIVRNTVEELVFNLFRTPTNNNTNVTGVPSTSKALELFDQECKILTIGDVISLFKSL